MSPKCGSVAKASRIRLRAEAMGLVLKPVHAACSGLFGRAEPLLEPLEAEFGEVYDDRPSNKTYPKTDEETHLLMPS